MIQLADFVEMCLEEAAGSEIARWAMKACESEAHLDGMMTGSHHSYRLDPSVDAYEAMAKPVFLKRP
jgi:hypothetical protein